MKRPTLTRKMLAEKIAGQGSPLTAQNTILEVVNDTLEVIKAELASGGKVKISGFGSFSTYLKPPRLGRNPKNGVPVSIPPMQTVKFRPSWKVKAKVNAKMS